MEIYLSFISMIENSLFVLSVLKTLHSLMESEIRARFAGLLNKKEHPKPSYSDWKELRSFVAEKAPQFYELVNASNLTSDEVDICIFAVLLLKSLTL